MLTQRAAPPPPVSPRPLPDCRALVRLLQNGLRLTSAGHRDGERHCLYKGSDIRTGFDAEATVWMERPQRDPMRWRQRLEGLRIDARGFVRHRCRPDVEPDPLRQLILEAQRSSRH